MAKKGTRYLVAGYLSKFALIQVILSPMYTGRRYHLQLRGIGWLLIAAVFALTVQPVHFHLQHIDDASSPIHEHAIDLHIAIDNIAPDSHKDGAVFPVTPDVMLKKNRRQPLAGRNCRLADNFPIECCVFKQATSHHTLHPAKTTLVFHSATLARSSSLLITTVWFLPPVKKYRVVVYVVGHTQLSVR